MRDFPFDVVGFDLDGTLLDTHEDLALAVNHVLASIGRAPLPASEVRTFVGGGAKLLLDRALAMTGGIPANEEALHAELLRFHAAHIAVHTAPFPGALAMLDALAGLGVKLAVVTNKREALAVQLFEELGLADRFFTIIGGDTLGFERRKPRPDMLEEMVRRARALGLAGRAAYVGDSSFDTGAARAAGLPCVAVRFGFNDLPADALGATAVIDHFDDLIAALEAL